MCAATISLESSTFKYTTKRNVNKSDYICVKNSRRKTLKAINSHSGMGKEEDDSYFEIYIVVYFLIFENSFTVHMSRKPHLSLCGS